MNSIQTRSRYLHYASRQRNHLPEDVSASAVETSYGHLRGRVDREVLCQHIRAVGQLVGKSWRSPGPRGVVIDRPLTDIDCAAVPKMNAVSWGEP